MSSSGRPGPGLLRRLRLRDVVLFTAPPFLVAMYLFVAGVLDYQRLSQFDDWWSHIARVDRSVWWRVRAALHLPRSIALDQSLSVEDTTRGLLDLRVERSAFDRIANDPIRHAGESIPAEIWQGNSFERVELKLRGDTSVHWSGEKKTLAIKSDRGKLFQNNRTTVFSVKEVLPQHIANSMAADYGLLAPPTAIVPVFLNQRFYGMSRSFAPLDETFLRNAIRIPGNIFRGDTAERGDVFKGLPRELFVNPYIWDRVAFNDRPGAIGTAKLFDFLARTQRAGSGELPAEGELATQLLQRAGPESSDATSQMFEILDRDEISRLLALMLTVGDPWHTSGVHNHFWYEDSSSGTLHPIPWDLRMLSLDSPPAGANYNRFWRAALRDPRVFAAALQAVHARKAVVLENAKTRLDEVLQRYGDGFEFDHLRADPKPGGPNPDVGSREEVLEALQGNLALLERWMGEARASTALASTSDGGAVLDVVVDGRTGIDWISFTLPGAPDCELFADADLDGILGAADRAIALEANGDSLFTLARAERLLPGVRATTRLEPEPISYRFFLRAPGADFSAFHARLTNVILGTSVQATAVAAGSVLRSGTSVHPWSMVEPAPAEIRIEGEVRLSATLEVPRHATLVIAPGAHIVLEPNVSIHCKGRVEALGTQAEPIVFTNADPRRPWGSLALWGEGADDSRFAHVRFVGGGGALLEGVEYTGMVCVHWARGVAFEDCEFTGNLRCDDALHADVAEVSLLRCWIHDTNADAVDYDMSGGLVEQCKIERAGNDGFDLMTCWPRLVNNQIQDNGDKGISVGENSTPVLFANTIRGCKRGIEVKDRSQPLILNNTITGNGLGVLARLKNWRYEYAGWPHLVRSQVSGNATDLSLDSGAHLTSLGARIGSPESTAADELGNAAWVYALAGIAVAGESIGVPEKWSTTLPASILHAEDFPTNWHVPGEHWSRTGGVTSLRVQDQCLLARLSTEAGSFARPVRIEVGADSGPHWLVLESSAVRLESARLRMARTGEREGQETIDVPIDVIAGGYPSFVYTVVTLPPGAYESIRIEADPMDDTARLYLHRWQLIGPTVPGDGVSR